MGAVRASYDLLTWWAVVALGILVTACAGSSPYMRRVETLQQPQPDKALVRFLRPSGMGALINFNVLDGEKVIGNSVAKSQFSYLAEPGHHLFVATAENKAFLEADLEAGKTYYVVTRIYPGAWTARVAFVPVTRGSELWYEALEYEKSLHILEPQADEIARWEKQNADKIRAVLHQYKFEWKEAYQWPVLRPEDGR
ncbi:MAG: hypothetical protein AB1578_17040 [Thermodesulfobacteriota bacterium]